METGKDRKKVRSPSFPAVDLREAVERARTVYEAERRNMVRPEIVVAHWGYSPRSSGGLQTIAALRAYGLLEGEGAVRLTDRAVHLALDDPGAPHFNAMVREAALAPPVHARLWERYGADLPSDKSLRSFLVLELGFNEGAVDLCLRNYRETLSFAGLGGGAKKEKEETQPPPLPSPTVSAPLMERSPFASLFPSDLTLSFPLLHGNRVELRVLRKIPPREAEQLRTLFGLWLEKITEPD
ncbi:MAG TPA: hypothetical protein VJ885_12210 [Thermoanaerobaculia bacterium]|nr:hypothetical protein [Thermoanaerobaculia bacterium]